MNERVRQSIAISGINTAEPCHTVADGAMEDIFNLRYKNGAFTSVYEPKVITPISNANGYEIIYTMECVRGKYIAHRGRYVHFVEINNGSVTSKQELATLPAEYANLKLSHFGSVLYVNYDLQGSLDELCFIYKDDKFTLFDMGAIEPPEFTIGLSGEVLNNGDNTLTPIMDIETKSNGEVVKTPLYNAHISKLQDLGYFVGFAFISVAYCMFDGSIIKCGQIHGVSSYLFRDPYMKDGLWLQKTDNIERYFAVMVGAKAALKITVPDSVRDSGMIKSIVVLASRVNPLYEYDKVKESFGKHGSTIDPSGFKYCGNNCIINETAIDLKQPLYQVAEIELDGNMSVELTYTDHFKDIESSPMYKASFSNHTTISGGRFEYNNRLHSYNVKLTPDVHFKIEPLNNELPYTRNLAQWGDDAYVAMKVHLKVQDEEQILIRRFKVRTVLYGSQPQKRFVMINNLLTYPDARVSKLELLIDVRSALGETTIIKREFAMKSSLENNMSYAFIDLSPDGNNVHYYAWIDITNMNDPKGETLPEETTISIYQTNKLYVSAMNNPFFTDAMNVYTIGDNSSVIDGICTATEQITETKFGLFPLYVFTNKAIHALEVGVDEIVYQRVIGISNDIKLPNTTTVGAANLVFFISARGVMAVEGRHITCMSDALNKYVGLQQSGDLFTDYYAKARLMYNQIENELILYNSNYNYAYLYSLTGRYWSRRDWVAREIGCQFEMYIDREGVVSSYLEDMSKPLSRCLLASRAIKLGSLEFKRLETIVARLTHGMSCGYEIKLFGSNDLQTWSQMAEANDISIIRRTSASYKFFKFALDCAVSDYFAVTNFDIEYYLRFVRKLR